MWLRARWHRRACGHGRGGISVRVATGVVASARPELLLVAFAGFTQKLTRLIAFCSWFLTCFCFDLTRRSLTWSVHFVACV